MCVCVKSKKQRKRRAKTWTSDEGCNGIRDVRSTAREQGAVLELVIFPAANRATGQGITKGGEYMEKSKGRCVIAVLRSNSSMKLR